MRIVPVIVCGGVGARLWPASRASYPKQFLPLLGSRSSFEETLLRVHDEGRFAEPLIVAGELHRFLVLHQLDALGLRGNILLEPEPRDSGPAVLAASLAVARRDPYAVILMLAADHLIADADRFKEDCAAAADAARAGSIVTFGVPPDRPSTEFGYIKPDGPVDGFDRVHAVKRFVEKPDAGQAKDLVECGCYWNSGNLCFLASTLIEEYRRSDPATVEAVAEAVELARREPYFLRLDAAAYARASRQPIDCAVMERTARAAVLPASFEWSDLGNWQSLWELTAKDMRGNAARGSVALRDVDGSYVESTENVVVAALGIKDMVVVARRDAVLVASRRRAGEVKELVDALRREGIAQVSDPPRVHRPWGWFQTLDSGHRFRVKRIVVRPGGRLSLQTHMHRAEHWVVVKGTARVSIGSKVRVVHENESTFIPVGEMHRLENPGRIDLEVVEVQSGSYTGEDDIVRLDDGQDP